MTVKRLDLTDLELGKNVKKTPQGFLVIPAYTARTGIQTYIMEDGSILNEFRPEDEVFSEKSMSSLRTAAVTNGHPEEMVNPDNAKELMLGHTSGVIEKVKDDYDFIIIDCSPSLGLITVNSLSASDSVIIPVQCEYFALEGLGKLLNTVKIVQKRLNPDLNIEGLLLTMYDSRLRLSNQVVEEVKQHFESLVFDTIIHRNSKISEAPSYGKPVIAEEFAKAHFNARQAREIH